MTASRRGTIAGLAMAGIGILVGCAVLGVLVWQRATVTWPLVCLVALPFLIAVIGGLIAFPDEVGPIVREGIDKVPVIGNRGSSTPPPPPTYPPPPGG